ncbi:FdtA/QdtA family cupin domain-containing protein [Psychrobium sp. MM17-31]|uniref:sugar 3,4-ketoisomerase n=1 Tax=Psychrobium sp. MM17-31 TaxID=2917758 RepID=UPI001EF726F1|nr:FdtA/QdtA family cupin domain-containing protein [Psychrobium sp. MM17-31]
MSLIKLIKFESLGDERGQLISLESNKNIPFDIKRVYYMHGMESDKPRGFHAHKDLQQVLVCVSGSCKILMDDGKQQETVELSDSSVGLFIDKMIWREMHDFSGDCVLMVLANAWYDESDYIRGYDVFKQLMSGENK